MHIRRYLVAFLAIALIATGWFAGRLLLPHGAEAAPAHVFLAEAWSAGHPVFRPTDVTPSGDSSLDLNRMDWSAWTSAEALGKGIVSVNTCVPDCASARYVRGPATVRLSNPQKVCGRWFFTRLDVLWTSGVPAGLPATPISIDEPPDC